MAKITKKERDEQERKAAQNAELFAAIKDLLYQFLIPQEVFVAAFEKGLVSGYKKDHPGEDRAIEIKIDLEKEEITYQAYYEIVEQYPVVVDELTGEEKDGYLKEGEITVAEARVMFDKDYRIGDRIYYDVTPSDFTRIAALNAKQSLTQCINEFRRERSKIDMQKRINELLNGIVLKVEENQIQIELPGAAIEGFLSKKEQVPNEILKSGDRIQVYVKGVEGEGKDSRVILSRKDAGFVRKLMELEVPEIKSGLVQVFDCVREAGYRTKIAVTTQVPDLDPVGACIGAKGVRINRVVDRLKGEKIDVILYSAVPEEFISRALSPAKAAMIQMNEEERRAIVLVPDDKLSLAIGKAGLNAKLAARLTGYKIDVKPYSEGLKEELYNEAEESQDKNGDKGGELF